ncbi:D-alanine--D-alanine ligase [Desulfonema limicola]|uniref:D-alanine--D-alanine ligase n=1 Tax=Desulfonema limicola TaxID=45656 RepID=A0A975B7L0_9BACT|nr:D-alanine--D-alanine ligase [Desulfonema limicola]QTA80298.1 D-alanine--D-alanine ligase [Desulfonema limicola]
MIIGLTYDLRREYLAMGYSEIETAEFDQPETIEAIELALQELGHETIRIGHAFQLMEKLVKGERWDMVFNIAEGLHGTGREAQVPAVLDIYNIPYTFSDPLVMCLTLHKGMTKRVIRDAGLATADFKVAESLEDIVDIPFKPPFFVKPVAEGTGMGVSPRSLVETPGALAGICRSLFEEFHQPVIIERFLPGREFTIGIAGTGAEARVLGTMEIVLLEKAEKAVYSFINKEDWKKRVAYRPLSAEDDPLAAQAEELALASWKILGARDGGRVDIRCDENNIPCFMEVNPLAGLRPEYSDLPILCGHFGISYVQLIEMIVKSAAKRVLPEKVLKKCA